MIQGWIRFSSYAQIIPSGKEDTEEKHLLKSNVVTLLKGSTLEIQSTSGVGRHCKEKLSGGDEDWARISEGEEIIGMRLGQTYSL